MFFKIQAMQFVWKHCFTNKYRFNSSPTVKEGEKNLSIHYLLLLTFI